MKTLLAIAAALTLVGCGKKKQEPKPEPQPIQDDDPDEPVLHSHRSAPRTGEARPQPKLTASVDGKPVEMTGAFAWVRPDGALEVMVTSVPASCEWATGQMRSLEDGEVDFDVMISRQLQPDGTFAWAMQQVSYDGNTRAGGVGPVTLEGDATAGKPTAATLAFELDSVGFGDEKVKHLKIDGTIDALGCPPPPPGKDVVAPPPAQAAAMTVAGQKVPIAGVAIQQQASGERTIVLSSAGVSCNGFPHAEDASLEITLHYQKDKDDVWQADLMGSWISGQQATQIFDGGKLVATPGATPTELTLSGSAKIMEYPVAIDGKVTAQVCPPS